jgi:hypothetical protein
MSQKNTSHVDELIKVLLDQTTSESDLRAIVEDHELNPKCGRQCQLCSEFAAKIFEIRDELPDTWFWIGEAVANHPNCSDALQVEIKRWVDGQDDGEWSRKIQEAIVANINIDPEKLKLLGISTENCGEFWEVKHHPRITDEIKGEILLARGWIDWPSDDYLSENTYIFEDAEELEEIQIDPDAHYQ